MALVKQSEITLVASGEVKFIVQEPETLLYVYSTDSFESSIYGYDGAERELIMTLPSDSHDDVRVNFIRQNDGTVLMELLNWGTEEYADQPVYVELAPKRYSMFSVISNEVTTVQVWEDK